MANISYVDGVYCNIQDAKIHINDRGYHFGDAVYEVIFYNNDRLYKIYLPLKEIQINWE